MPPVTIKWDTAMIDRGVFNYYPKKHLSSLNLRIRREFNSNYIGKLTSKEKIIPFDTIDSFLLFDRYIYLYNVYEKILFLDLKDGEHNIEIPIIISHKILDYTKKISVYNNLDHKLSIVINIRDGIIYFLGLKIYTYEDECIKLKIDMTSNVSEDIY